MVANMLANDEANKYETCPVCSGTIRPWRVKKAGNERYALDLCTSCGYSFVNPRPTLSFLMNYYSAFGHSHDFGENNVPSLRSILANEKNYPNSTLDAKRIINKVASLSANGPRSRFLDVGCGYGFFSKEALAAGFDVLALELAENERGIAREMTGRNPVACSFEEFDCPPGSLSVVLMSQTLEHAVDVNAWVQKAHGLLADDGMLVVALPNYGSIFRLTMQENDPFICPPAHLNFFNPNSISKLLEKHGFAVEAIQWVSRMPSRTFEKRLLMIAKPILPVVTAAASVLLRTLDVFHLGMIINIYARKRRA